MADPLPPDEPFLSSYMRVQRGKDTAQDLISLFAALEQEAASGSSELAARERRRVLDLPDADEEAANIRRVTSRSRSDLISDALSQPGHLSDDELELLNRRFWAAVTPQETQALFNGRANASQAIADRIFAIQQAAFALVPTEHRSFTAAAVEIYNRDKRRRDDETAQRLGAACRHAIPDWMDALSQRFQDDQGDIKSWGFVALVDTEAQESMSAERRDLFEATIEGVLWQAMTDNGAGAKLLTPKWGLLFFDVHSSTKGHLEEPDGAYETRPRSAFRALLDSSDDGDGSSPDAAAALVPDSDVGSAREILQQNRGLRTDVFLVVNKECVDSVLGDDNPYLDDLRILALEADYPQPDRTYAEGYQGWTWVRLEQLVYRFYGACTRGDIGLDDVWKAAQASRHHAFTSLDPAVATSWTSSTSMSGAIEPSYHVHY